MAKQNDVNMEPFPEGNQVVHVRSDSDTELQLLFDHVLQPKDTQRPLQVPFSMRNLPKSFFLPPSTGSKTPSQTSLSVSQSREQNCESPNGFQNPHSPNSASPTPPTVNSVHHARAHSSPASLQATLAAAANKNNESLSAPVHSKQQSLINFTSKDPGDGLGLLPPGVEKAHTQEGQVYFLNHINQTTSWDDPRKKPQLTSHGSTPNVTASHGDLLGGGGASARVLGPLPDGWEPATTPEGDTYFINHATQTTTWFDPRLPQSLQKQALLQQMVDVHKQQAQQQGAPPPINGTPQNLVARQHQLRLQQLQRERERLQQKQAEINRQFMVPQMQERSRLNGHHVHDPHSQGALQEHMLLEHREESPATTQLDPFLSSHPRQESADSGLEMGNSYSLPHTPEDILSSVDDLDSDGSSSTRGASDVPSSMDVGDTEMQVGDNNTDNTMDDLIPSIEDLSGELDVQALLNNNKMDNVLTWL